MKTFILIFLLFISFQSLTKSDDISDFEIEGISIGDNALDHFSKSKIKNNQKNYYKDDLNKNRVLNCGTVIHENVIKNNKFKPKYYILIEYDNELLLKVNKIEKSIVAKKGKKIVAYAIVINKAAYGLNKLFDDLIDRVNNLKYDKNYLNKIDYALVGQLCIRKNYRGKGLVKDIYNFFKKEYSKKYKYLITDIDERNTRSLKAHIKNKFQIIDNFYWGDSYWNIILWNWNNKKD